MQRAASHRYGVPMLLAEDVLLLLTDDVTGKARTDSVRLDLVLAGAVLVELMTLERVAIAQPGGPVRAGRLVVVDGSPVGDGVLDEGLRRIAASRPRKPESMLPVLHDGLRLALYGQLAARGLVREQEGKVLGLFSVRRWPAVSSRYEQLIWTSVRDVLVGGRPPTPTEAHVIALLQSVDAVPTTLGDVGVPARELRRRAKAVAGSAVGSDAVRKAVDAVSRAVAAAQSSSS